MEQAVRRKTRAINAESILATILIFVVFGYFAQAMGVNHMFKSLMATAHKLLLDTVFSIMAVAVLAGAVGAILTEFGFIALLNRLLSPLMGPLYGLPGAATLGMLTTFLSDNPAIVSLTKDQGFRRYFKQYQIPALCNLGTAFGMGLILISFMVGHGYAKAAFIGLLGAVIGSIVSVRLMMHHSKNYFAVESNAVPEDAVAMDLSYREVRDGSIFQRFLEATLEGGKNGVEMGMAIIPGVLFICTLVLMLTFGPANPAVGYQGLAYEGVGLLPKIGHALFFILRPLFGFSSPEAVAFPVTALGAVGAAMGLIPRFIEMGILTAGDVAVFTAMGMCWSGYLSTHVAMMDALGVRKLTNKAIFSHTLGGIAAGIAANLLMRIL